MIVVTAPTGNIGHVVVGHLLDAGEAIRVIVRDSKKLPDGVRDRVDIVEGSHGDSAVVERAFAGADALFWLAPPDASKTLEEVYLDFTRPAAEAIRRHGVKRVVSITALGRGTEWEDTAGLVTASIRMDDLLMQTGAAFRGLAMPSFMDNALQQVQPLRAQGTFFGPIRPDRKLPMTATRDMGAAAARLLADDGWSDQTEVPLLGPEDLSFDDMASVMSGVLGRPIRYQQIPFDAFKARLAERGASESFQQGYVDMMRAKDEGMDNVAERDAAAHTPTTFRQWCEDELKPAVMG